MPLPTDVPMYQLGLIPFLFAAKVYLMEAGDSALQG